jgi:U3 small nucleolar ribonucleoprotein protein IMP4
MVSLQACRSHDFTDVVVVQETRGQPDGLIVCHLPLGPTAYFTISNTVMRHDIEDRGTVSEAYPHLIMEGFESQLGKEGDLSRWLV